MPFRPTQSDIIKKRWHSPTLPFQDALHSVDFDVDKIVPTHSREMVITSTSANVTLPTIEDDIDDLVEPKSTVGESEGNETINKNIVAPDNTTQVKCIILGLHLCSFCSFFWWLIFSRNITKWSASLPEWIVLHIPSLCTFAIMIKWCWWLSNAE